MAAVAPRVRVRDAKKVEIFLPVRTLFFEWRIAKANLNPARNVALTDTRLRHVVQIFIAGDRVLAECLGPDRPQERCFLFAFSSSKGPTEHGPLW
jgi:hypothetical protein